MLTEKQIERLRDSIHCTNPVYLFDDDPDGLVSFLLLYEIIKEGRGICVKSSPQMKAIFAMKALETDPDRVFILDKPIIEDDFFGHIKCPIIWIDHHDVQQVPTRVLYINPRSNDKDVYYSTTYCVYEAFKAELKRPWLAAVGIIGDWCMPSFLEELRENYPDLLGKGKTLDDITKDGKISQLIRIFSFILKGKTTEVNACIKLLHQIEHYNEIFEQSTPQGKRIWKKYLEVEKEFERVKKEAERIEKGNVIAIISENEGMSFSRDMATDMIRENPKKIIIVARRTNGEIKGSIRTKKIDLKEVMPTIVLGLDGYAGGHEHAHGFLLKEDDFKVMMERMSKL